MNALVGQIKILGDIIKRFTLRIALTDFGIAF